MNLLQVASNVLVLTDVPEVLPSIIANVGRNMLMTDEGEAAVDVVASALDWCQAARDVPRIFQEGMRTVCAVPTRKEIAEAAAHGGSMRKACKLLVLAADCVWVAELVQPFLNTLREIHARVPWTRYVCVLLAYKSRSKSVDDLLFAGLREIFDVSEVPLLSNENRGSVQLWLACAPGGKK
jgi:hypothetical protein